MSLRYVFREIVESSLGRIYWTSNMWAVIGSKWDKRRLQNSRLIGCSSMSINDKGEWDDGVFTLVRKRNTWCPNPPMSKSEVYKQKEKDLWNVPATECRRCQYHKASRRGRRFPICEYKGGSIEKAAATISGIIKDATDKAMVILK